LKILNQFFTHLSYVPIYARLQIFYSIISNFNEVMSYYAQLPSSRNMLKMSCSAAAETHAFRRLRKSLITLLIVVCGKSSQICCFYNVNKHVGYDMTPTVTSFAQ